MQQFDLFDVAANSPQAETTDDAECSHGIWHMRRGAAGEHIVVADLLIREHEASILNGIDADVIAQIGGCWRGFQVKATAQSDDRTFGNNGGTGHPIRGLMSYKGKIDAFAFVSLPTRLVFYYHIDALSTDVVTLSPYCWSRQACEASFLELLRRWGVVNGVRYPNVSREALRPENGEHGNA